MKELQLNTLHDEKSFVKHMRAPQPQFSFRSHQRPMKKLTTINDLEPGERALDEDNNDDDNDDNYLVTAFLSTKGLAYNISELVRRRDFKNVATDDMKLQQF
ncbi:hypothetical protein GQX74_013796 [Glossina fuscipes]|nr:hypothetical protein GQX74_013796 [Glossina fuscipes]